VGEGEGDMTETLKDRWGKYLILSGNESPDTCFWCGNPCKNRYCSPECKHRYWMYYFWKYARDWCVERAGKKCEICGGEPKCWVISAYDGSLDGDLTQKDTRLEVHHITPIAGEQRIWSALNHPDNLVCLCRKCHKKMRKGGS